MIALLAIVFTIIFGLVFGIPSWYYQRRGDIRAEEDSRATAEGTRLATESNRLTMWQLCKSEEEFQDTPTCVELMKSGPFNPEKRDVSRRISVPELEYSEASESLTSHHELLVHLLTRRLQLGRQLDDLHIEAEQSNHSDASQDAGIRMQLTYTANSISQSESHILTLLLLATSAKKVNEDLTSTNFQSKLGIPTSYPVPFNADIAGPSYILRLKGLAFLGTGRLRQDFTMLWRILTNLIENASEVRVSNLVVMKYYNLLLAATSGLVVYANPLRADDTLQVRVSGRAQAEPRSIRDCHHFAAPRCCVPNICQCGDGKIYKLGSTGNCGPPGDWIANSNSQFPGYCC
ncbi:hypothetical protein E8E14_011834 [Neopestalotiopsis sp. 37M]|nr:hypothetical protein E8E14_011834 [Neopestalotiopsis sp. 37M]